MARLSRQRKTSDLVSVLKGRDFTGYGETPSGWQEASGHDFSRADKANRMSGGLQPLPRFISEIHSDSNLFPQTLKPGLGSRRGRNDNLD